MEKKKEFIINTMYVAVICAIVYICINYLLPVLFPFIMGFVFAYAALRISRRLFDENNRFKRAGVLTALYVAVGLVIALLVSLGITKLGDFIKTLPVFYKNTVEPYIGSLESVILRFNDSLPDSIADVLSKASDGLFEGLKGLLSTVTTGLVNATTSFITTAPDTLVSIITMMVASYYLVMDYENISGWLNSVLPEKVAGVFEQIHDFCENTLFKIVGSYAAIMALTFFELFVGLSLIGISNSGMWSFIISFLDILPVLGVGTVLIPWGISLLLTRRYLLGIGILIIYLIITVIRNIVEPRLVGTNLGLHPLVTLIAMMVGLRLFSLLGMFGLPLTLSFFLSMDKENRPVLNGKKKEKKPEKKKKQ